LKKKVNNFISQNPQKNLYTPRKNSKMRARQEFSTCAFLVSNPCF